MYGDGHRRTCPCCGREVLHDNSRLSNLELRGPRNITSTNLDRLFDDSGKRFLIVEEKRPGEAYPGGQRKALIALAHLTPLLEVWVAEGTPEQLQVYRLVPVRSNNGDQEQCAMKHLLASGTFGDYQKLTLDWFGRQMHGKRLPR